ncbi:hypothetical protein ACVWYG_000952 [Pedobacter sp. UYEF25]
MNFKSIGTLAFSIWSTVLVFENANAQVVISGAETNGSQSNNIISAVPFLLITPDARIGAMGNAGVAVSPDVNAASINPAKLAFLDKPYGFSVSYSPWLKNLVPDINLAYLSGYYKFKDRYTLASSFRYFSLGQLALADGSGQELGIANPNELAVDVSFATSFGDHFSLGSAVRYIYSNVTGGQYVVNGESHAGNAVAVDVSGFYKAPAQLFNKNALISAGVNISNIGTKMSYGNTGPSLFLPGNLKIGAAATSEVDELSTLTFALDFNKLLVPTQPFYDANNHIIAGRDPNRSLPSGIIGSFIDAPGGFNEELREVGVSTGAEYWYNQQFALRAGYNYQSPSKGNSRYFTIGAGLKYNVFNIDFAYLVANTQTSPLANTLRFSLLFNFGEQKMLKK